MAEQKYHRITVGDAKVCPTCERLENEPSRTYKEWQEAGLLPGVAPTECEELCRCGLVPDSLGGIQEEVDRLIERAVSEGFDRGIQVDLIEGRKVLLKDFIQYEDLLSVSYEKVAEMEDLIYKWKVANNGAKLPVEFYKNTRITDMTRWLEDSLKVPDLTKIPKGASGRAVVKSIDKADEIMEKYFGGLPEEDIQVIKEYTDRSYLRWNKYLRTGDEALLIEGDLEKINRLSKILNEAPTYQGDVIRGVKTNRINFENVYGKIKEGDILNLKGFTSTTADTTEIIAKSFLPLSREDKLGVFLRIKSKSGVYLDGASEYGNEELEILFNNNTPFKIIKRIDREDGILELIVEEIV